MMLMLMIQLPFTDDQNVGGAKNKVKSHSDSICEWKLEEKNTPTICFKWPSIYSSFKPGDFVRRVKPANNTNYGLENSFVVSTCGGNVIVSYLKDRDGNVIVDLSKKKKDGC